MRVLVTREHVPFTMPDAVEFAADRKTFGEVLGPLLTALLENNQLQPEQVEQILGYYFEVVRVPS